MSDDVAPVVPPDDVPPAATPPVAPCTVGSLLVVPEAPPESDVVPAGAISGVPGSLVPSDRRKEFFNNQLRSQSEALNLVRQLELGRISR